MSRIITPGLVSLDEPLGDDKADVIRALAQRVVAQGRARDAEELFADAWARELKDETGLPGGIGIPHARSASVTEPTLAFARLTPGVDFGAPDGPADIVFLIAAPAGADEAHLSVLSQLARSLMRPEFLSGLRTASTADEAVSLVVESVAPSDAAEPAPAPRPAETRSGAEAPETTPVRIVAVTACATGIAHTFMAADALTAAGAESGVDLVVEPQGSSGYQALPQEVIDAADAVIFAVDVDVREQQRFAGKPVVRAGVKRGIEQPKQLIDEALAATRNPNAPRVSGDPGSTAAASTESTSWGRRVQRILLTGVSYMIPFVAGGGLLIALGFLLGGFQVTAGAANVITQNSLWDLPSEGITSPLGPLGQYLGSVAFMIGSTSMGFLVSALAGYIAFAIADRPGIAPGFVAGAVAVLMNAGFIGGIIGGLLAGFIAWWLGRFDVPRWLRGLMPVVIIPLLGSIAASGLMVLFLGRPIAALMTTLTDWLTTMSQSSLGAVALGIILGLMMCFDLGGPVNKVAYAFATAGLAAAGAGNTAPYLIMAAVMAAGMVPPLAMALASTLLARRSFTPVERENGVAAWLLGLSFISEGAIPFAAADPLRVIPASMVGGAVTGALSMLLSVQSYAPHGGLFVLFAIQPWWGFLLAVAAGTVVSALLVVVLKKWARRRVEEPSADAEGSQVAAVPA